MARRRRQVHQDNSTPQGIPECNVHRRRRADYPPAGEVPPGRQFFRAGSKLHLYGLGRQRYGRDLQAAQVLLPSGREGEALNHRPQGNHRAHSQRFSDQRQGHQFRTAQRSLPPVQEQHLAHQPLRLGMRLSDKRLHT